MIRRVRTGFLPVICLGETETESDACGDFYQHSMSTRSVTAKPSPEAHFTAETFRAWSAEAEAASGRLRLAFAREVRGGAGRFGGAGSGVSIDFKDHRHYLPGDDPRHINWQAYARSGTPVLKVFHEEVSPELDLVVDLSGSHRVSSVKLSATLRLALFAAVSARRRGASVKVRLLRGGGVTECEPGVFLSGRWELPGAPATETGDPAWDRVPWRTRAMRVIVSDLLFTGEPEHHLAAPTRGGARTVILAPYTRDEVEPDWSGHVVLVDSETGEQRPRLASESMKSHYREAYRRHFDGWDVACRRRGATLVRIAAEDTLASSLLRDASRLGAVEPV